ncbi:MAG: acylphosphatase [Selenomonadaceae bacterium]|nr:acylphosphatase [Selenomonadaceae bacterium]
MKHLFALALLMLLLTSSADAARIESVRAVVTAQRSLPSMVKERMEDSVRAIGEQLLSGHELPITNQWRLQQSTVIKTVFDKILVGYSVQSVELSTVDTSAIINVELQPWTNTIANVDVDVTVEGMPDELETLVRNDLADIDRVFEDGLRDLPIAAADWTNGILKRRLNSFMDEHLPEFRADFDTEFSASTAHVLLNVYPRVPVVRMVSLSMHSNTMSNMALVTHRTLMEERVNLLVGVPVAFVARHQADIEELIREPLDAQKDFRALKMESKVELNAGEKTSVMIRSDSDRYRLRLSGWVDIGRSSKAKDDFVFRMHVGRKVSTLDEVFMQLDAQPQDVHFKWSLGYARSFDHGTSAAIRYDFTSKDVVTRIEQEFLKDWVLRYEHRFDDDKDEAAVRYRLHDFLDVECVVDNKESWLRFIGHF